MSKRGYIDCMRTKEYVCVCVRKGRARRTAKSDYGGKGGESEVFSAELVALYVVVGSSIGSSYANFARI